jgi:glycosyltransferase involved in cell wall biosynthesis
LLRDKGIVEYAEAARRLKPRYPTARFQLVGPHDANPSAISRQQLEAWRSEGIIEYSGATDDVRSFLAGAGVFVLPSYREGTPMSVLEAMATGRPIVTTDVPGCRETVVPGENGFLVPAKDVAALAAAMERFIVAPELIPKMGRRSREIAVEKFDVRAVNAVILKTLGL